MKKIGNAKHISDCLIVFDHLHRDAYKIIPTRKITGKMLQILFLIYFEIHENTVC